MRILITGLLPYDSGKTEFTLGLGEALKESGFDIGYFKPLAGHNGWYQYETLIYSNNTGLLIGHDAYIAAEKLGLINLLPIISPLDILTFPIDPLGKVYSSRSYIEHMSSTAKTTVLMRYTRSLFQNNKLVNQHLYVVCKDTVEKLTNDLRETLENLINSLKQDNTLFIEANTLFVEKFLENPQIYKTIDENLVFLDKFSVLLIESYNDAAAPTMGSLDSDYVFVVAPGKALLYEGDRFKKAVLVSTYRGYPWGVRLSTVFEVLGKPLRKYDIPLKLYSEKYRAVFNNIAEFITGRI
ncbi:ATPase [Staphylothermus hellenicus]|uniref:p-loop ATPase/GTPase-like protein n=1 Tax=Staphylothermus hellenicus (strain DSM 12710 / JCM 10830 / BK20S6-10-b1 / P8) TaxID=591019 RepID=D7D8U3_STAHD|nr:ATPase [Staphylothermus hellenicus]ADI32189.1 P-loop ATPase/GTPase-like protein [Staphylothermus hellenicus DSM 12710]